MEEKIKIIQISSASHSFSMQDYEKDIFVSWYARVAFQLKESYPGLEIECWTPERKYPEEKIKINKAIKFRIFPTNLSIRHGIEISFPMINALEKEIKTAEKEGKKLILHFHEYHSLLVYSILFFIKKTQNLKIIAQHHGARAPFENINKHKKLIYVFPAIAALQFLENISLNKIDLFYALSDSEISYLKRKKCNVKFQTMGVEEEYFKSITKEKARNLLGMQRNKSYLLYIGRIKTNKGIKELLDAVKLFPDSELLLIGDGPEFALYKNYAEKEKIKNVKFLGLIYGEKKLLYLSASDCLILPSYTEGAPVVLMEAIAKNLPVIATNVGGVSKMIENRREGLLISPKSSSEIAGAIKEILSWKKKNIKKHAENYKWEKIINQTFKDYKSFFPL